MDVDDKKLDRKMRDFKTDRGVKQKMLVPVEVVPRMNVGSHEGRKRLHMLHKRLKAGVVDPSDVSPEDAALLQKYYGW